MHTPLALRRTLIALGSLLAATLAPSAHADDTATAPDATLAPKLVDALNTLFGERPGLRKAHPKGICVAGSFSPDAASAATITIAKPFTTRAAYPVIGRFSIAGGNPAAPDNEHTARGLALRLAPDAESDIDLVLLSAPLFGASTPEEFLGLLTTVAPDPATGKQNQARIQEFFKNHPAATRQPAWLAGHPVTGSYAATNYYGIHAFRYVDAAGKKQVGKIVAQPVGGESTLSDDEAKARGPDFLFGELQARLAKGPAAIDLAVQLGEPGDPTNDPSLVWPDARKRVHLGRLTLERATGDACYGEMFLPTRITAGVETTDDPVLPVRAAAYGVSYSKRLSGK